MGKILGLAFLVLLAVSAVGAQETFERAALVIGQKGSPLTIAESGNTVTANSEVAGQTRKVIIAVDNSNSMTKVLPKISQSIIKSLPASLSVPVKLIVYNEQVEELSKFTTDVAELSHASSGIRASGRKTSFLTVLAYLHSSTEAEGSHVILITDGETEYGTYNTQRLSEEYTSKNIVLSYVNWRIREDGVRSVTSPSDVVSTQHDSEFVSMVFRSGGVVPKPSSDSQKGRIKFAPSLLLSTIINRTGGEVVNISNFSDLEFYLENRYSEVALYKVKWQTVNPEAWFTPLSGSTRIDKMLHPRIW